MDTLQGRHAKSVAEHMARYAKPFVSQMEAFARMNPEDFGHMTVAEFKAVVNSNMGGMLTELEQVIDDMYPDFPPDEEATSGPIL